MATNIQMRLRKASSKLNRKQSLPDYKAAKKELELLKAVEKELRNYSIVFSPEAAKCKWDEIEIQGVSMTATKSRDGKYNFYCEPTDDPNEIDIYSVYLHVPDEGVMCIADLPTLELANSLANLLRNSVRHFSGNVLYNLQDEF